MKSTYFNFVFFFQAEDGIRDLTVTGVQTCALPILAYAALGQDRNNVFTSEPARIQSFFAAVEPSVDFDWKIGRASCRERGWMAGVAGSVNIKERGCDIISVWTVC